MRIATIFAAVLFLSLLTPVTVFAHYPHTSDQCPTTEQLGNVPECLQEQRESGKEVKFVDMYFSEGVDNIGGNENTNIPTKIEAAPGDGTTKLVAVMANSGSFVLTGTKAWLSLPLGFQAVGRNVGEPAFDSYDLAVPVSSVFDFEFQVIVTKETRVGMYNAMLHVEYFKERDIGMSFRDFNVEFLLPGRTVINTTNNQSVIPTITPSPLIVSIYNNGTAMMSNVEVTISTPITATVALNQQVPEASKSPIMIIGGDGYTKLNSIKPGEKADVKVTLFASTEAVNTAFQLPVNIVYVDPNGVSKQIQRFVSVYVQGTISLRINDLGITYIANQPNLSGYLLNEGTNTALFTTVELVDNQGKIKQVGAPQYLGDLTANSPLPFNIPMKFEGSSEASYPVKIRITYKDDLRNPFDTAIDGKISYTPPVVKKSNEGSPLMSPNIMMVIAGAIGGVGVAGYYFVRRSKSKSKVLGADKGTVEDDDIDFLTGGSKK